MPRIAEIIRTGIAEGYDNDRILATVLREHPAANTSPACVAYYRSEARRNERIASGLIPATRQMRRAATRAARPVLRVRRATTEAFDASVLSTRRFGIEFEFVGNGRSMETFGRVIERALAAWPSERLTVRGDYHHSNGRTWDLKRDGSCEFELATPALTGADWPKVVAVLKAIRDAGGDVDQRCGMHVHHETRGGRVNHLRNLIRLWGAFDETLLASLPRSRRSNSYCRRMERSDAERMASQTTRELRDTIRYRDRYQSLNLTGWWRQGRVEVRSHHGTLDADKTGQWIAVTQAIVNKALTTRQSVVTSWLVGVTSARDVFARFNEVVGDLADQIASWMSQRNPDYFTQLATATEAA